MAVFFFIVILALSFILLDMTVFPSVCALAETAVRGQTSECINDGVRAVCSDLKFEDIYTVARGSNGDITGIFLDSLTVNKLKTEIVSAVIEQIEESDITLDVPFGSAFGNLLFSGRGNKVKVKLLSVGAIESEIVNKIEDSGVNQTHLSSYLSIKADISARIGRKNIKTSTTGDVLLCESVIVGKVPESFTNINVIDNETLRWLNSYK